MLLHRSIIQKAFLSVIFCMTVTSSYGQNDNDSDNLYLYTKSSNEATVYSIDEISKITFSKSGVQIWNTNWPTEYAYSNVRVLVLTSQEGLLLGDANGDGVVNVADITEIINYRNGRASNKFDEKRADISGNGSVDQADIDQIVKILLQK